MLFLVVWLDLSGTGTIVKVTIGFDPTLWIGVLVLAVWLGLSGTGTIVKVTTGFTALVDWSWPEAAGTALARDPDAGELPGATDGEAPGPLELAGDDGCAGAAGTLARELGIAGAADAGELTDAAERGTPGPLKPASDDGVNWTGAPGVLAAGAPRALLG